MADESPLLTLETGRGELKLSDVGPAGAVPLVEVDILNGTDDRGHVRLCIEQAEQAAAALAEWAHVARRKCEQMVGVLPKAPDWTAAAGRSNSSLAFVRICDVVEGLIRSSAASLIAGRADSVAELIVLHLAHKHGMQPPAVAASDREGQ